jgi:prepilin-type N-terminal cleavage/methylation domain-containing protein
MTTPTLQNKKRRQGAKGFTLLEVSTAMSLMVVLSGALVVMLQQHLAFTTLAGKQSFLADEAPKIGSLVGRIFNQADHYFVYANVEGALGNGTPVLADGRAVKLSFKSSAQESGERIIAAETDADGTSLRFYTPLPDGTQKSWTICSNLQGAAFSADLGILTVTLRGPNGEEITYSGGGQ